MKNSYLWKRVPDQLRQESKEKSREDYDIPTGGPEIGAADGGATAGIVYVADVAKAGAARTVTKTNSERENAAIVTTSVFTKEVASYDILSRAHHDIPGTAHTSYIRSKNPPAHVG